MADVVSCPKLDDLQRFLVGRLSEADATRLQQHLAGCPHCLDTLHNLEPKDTLVEAMRAQGQVAARSEDAVVAGLMAQLSGQEPPIVSQGVETTTDGVRPAAGSKVEDCSFLAPAEAADELGRLGGYRVLKILGAGGMGLVFEAEDPRLKRRVALKVMKPALAANPLARQRFLREAQAVAALEHDHIVAIYEVEEDRGVPFLAMPLLQGEALEDHLERVGRLPRAEVLRIGREIAEGLAAAHERGLIHRDVKPANVWLEGRTGRVKVLDFGLARPAMDDAHLTLPGTVAGTPHYMAPEQARGEPVDVRGDLFSLGCVLYRMATGRLPFQGANTLAVLHTLAVDQPPPPRAVNPAVPRALSDLTMRLLAKEPQGRPQTAREVIASLAAIERAEAERVQRRAPWRALLAAVLLFAVAGPVAWFGPAAVFRFATNQGQLVIETDDPDVEVSVRRNGAEIKLVDHKTGREVLLEAGRYDLVLAKGKDGLRLSTREFTLERGGKQTVKVWFEPAVIKPPQPEVQVGEVRSFEGHEGYVYCVAFSPDGRLALSGGKDAILRLWEVATGRDLGHFEGQGTIVSSVAFSPDGRRALSADGNTLRLWDVETRKEIRHLVGHTALIQSVAFSRDGRRALSGGQDHTMRLWDLDTGTEIRVLRGHSETIYGVAFSPDGKLGLSGSGGYDQKPLADHDYSMRLWDLETGQELRRFGEHKGVVVAVAFTPDGTQVLSGGNLARLWDVKSGQEVRHFGTPYHQVWSASFSADGKRLVTGSPDRSVRLWDAATGKQLWRSAGHADFVRGVAISADGRQALSGSYDATVRLWRLPEPGTDWPRQSPDGPFVVLTGTSKVERKYATLADAVLAADSGNTIEVRGNGPFDCPPLIIEGTALTIRAADGVRPVLQFSACEPTSNASLYTNSALVLEGLEIRRVGDDQAPSNQTRMILSDRAPFHAAHCRFLQLTTPVRAVIAADGSPEVVVRNCLFAGNMNPALGFAARDQAVTAIVDNCVVASGTGEFISIGNARDIAPGLDLKLSNNSVATNVVIGFHPRSFSSPGRPPAEPVAGAGKLIRIELVENVLDVPVAFGIYPVDARSVRPATELEQEAARLIEWREQKNLYRKDVSFVQLGANVERSNRDAELAANLRSLADWDKYRGLTETGSQQGVIALQGGDLRTRVLKAAETITHADFRLAATSAGKGDGGRARGADVDRVGPGLAYENWKRTPDYRQWLQEPFVVLARAGQPERSYSTLAWAVAEAVSGDVIEIRGNGPFVTPAIHLGKRALVLRAGAGFEPVLQIDPMSLAANVPLLQTEGPLVLEGLHFRHVEDTARKEPFYALISSYRAPLSVTHCRFFVKGSRSISNLYPAGSPQVKVRHCEFAGASMAAINCWGLASFHQLEVADCLCWGPGHFVVYSQYPPDVPRAIAVRLVRNTFVGHSAIQHYYQQLVEPPANIDLRPFRVEARDNVLDATYSLFTLTQTLAGKYQPEIDQPQVPRCLAWKESKNLYTGDLLSFDHNAPRPAHLTVIKDLRDWEKYWGLRDTSSLRGRLRFQGGNVRATKAATPDKLTAADFRLHRNSDGKGEGENGRDLGVDVDQVGPGKAYEAWKKTPAYPQWLTATGQVRDPEPFVVLPTGRKREFKFASLAEAVDFARSGDVLEVRGDGPFVTEPVQLGDKALTLRAGAGFAPVIQLSAAGIKAGATLLDTAAPLTVEGLEFHRVGTDELPQKLRYLLASTRAPLHLAHCRFRVQGRGSNYAVHAYLAPRVEVRSCFLTGDHNTWLHFVTWVRPPGGRLLVENCVSVTKNNGVGIIQEGLDSGEAPVRLVHNTFLAGTLLAFGFDKLDAAPDSAIKPTPVEVSGNLFDVFVISSLGQVSTKHRSLDFKGGQARLRELFAWREQRNLYQIQAECLWIRPEPGSDQFEKGLKGLTEWHALWEASNTGSLAAMPRYQSDRLNSRNSSQYGELRVEDFRLQPGSPGQGAGEGGHDLGADVSLVGPGPAYDYWKKTPQYQEWLKTTGQRP